MTSEMGGVRMRKKVSPEFDLSSCLFLVDHASELVKSTHPQFMGFGTTVDVIYRIVFTAVVPFFLNDPLYMGARFAFVMGGFAIASWFFAVLMVPETMGRSLEEMDELFAVSLLRPTLDFSGGRSRGRAERDSEDEGPRSFQMKLWPWQWRSAVTTGIGSRVRELEMGRDVEMDLNTKDKLAIEHVSEAGSNMKQIR
jgi:hypothetical protein